MDIGARIKQKRTQAGLTQVQLGKLCKVGQSAIANIESGQNPSNALMLCIASALKVDPSYLLTGGGTTDFSIRRYRRSHNKKGSKNGDITYL